MPKVVRQNFAESSDTCLQLVYFIDAEGKYQYLTRYYRVHRTNPIRKPERVLRDDGTLHYRWGRVELLEEHREPVAAVIARQRKDIRLLSIAGWAAGISILLAAIVGPGGLLSILLLDVTPRLWWLMLPLIPCLPLVPLVWALERLEASTKVNWNDVAGPKLKRFWETAGVVPLLAVIELVLLWVWLA